MRYPKQALSFSDQLAQLQQRGLEVVDPARAMHWLQRVSYYRLSAYFLPFKDGEDFLPGTEFNDIAGLYIFDRKLRLLVLDAIERIEVALRTAITYEIGHAYGPFGHTDPANFAPSFDHAKFMAELSVEERRAKETFASHFRRKYTGEPHLPVWMATELLSFGTVSMLYSALSPPIKRKLASEYGVPDRHFGSWLHSLSYLRNTCAHHKRLWNRQFAIKPQLPSRSLSWPHDVPGNGRIYCMLVLIQHMLKVVSPRCHWSSRLFDAHSDLQLAAMQIPSDWRTRAIWR
ncbi:MAG: Abi family protein [Pseudomonadota bacterium]|nr:Abi family protein [Pseudomonadota bacterium]